MTVGDAGNNDGPSAIVAPTGLKFQIKETKLYVLVVTLSKENDIKLFEQPKSGFKKLQNGTNIDHKWLFNLKITT